MQSMHFMIFNVIKDILDKKVPFKIDGDDTSYRKLNHIMMTNAPRNLIGEVLFDYDSCEIHDDYSLQHFYNKKNNIWVDLKVRYVCFIGEPYKSHFKVTGYQIYKKFE